MNRKVNTNPLFKGAHEYIQLITNGLTARVDGVVIIEGNGLEPMYHDGDTVMLERCNELPVGTIGVFEFPDIGIAIRYKGKDALYRINPESEDRVRSATNAHVLARVIGQVTPDMIVRDDRETHAASPRP